MYFYLEIPVRKDEADFLLEEAGSWCHRNKISPKIGFSIRLAIEALTFQAIKRSDMQPGNFTLKVRMRKEDDFVRIIFSDNTPMFNPLEITEKEIAFPMVNRDNGGVEIGLIQKIMDEMYYDYQNNKNIIHMIKLLD